MFNKYIVGEGTVRNLAVGGEVVGFAFDTRITYYRGLGVSMIEPFEVRVDGGEPFPAETLRFMIGERTWTFEQLSEDGASRWELTEPATVSVLTPGGLAPGVHTLDVTEVLRVSYLPMPSRNRYACEVEIA